MNIEINPKLVDTFNALAAGQGMTPEAYGAHVIEKYAKSQLRRETEMKLQGLDSTDLEQVKASIDAIIEAKPKSPIEPPQDI